MNQRFTHGSVLILLVTHVLACFARAADAPLVTYTKSFPGSLPPYVAVTVARDGTGVYNESKDPDNEEKIRVDVPRAGQIFELAEKLDHFAKPLESGLKVANMGEKMFRWSEGGAITEATFNYSTSEDAKALTAQFEAIVESSRLFIEFRRAIRYDRLGVNSVVNRAVQLWETKRLATAANFRPLLEQVAKNESYLHMARERAAQLVDALRAAGHE